MKQRFFLNGIDMQRRRITVNEGGQFAVPDGPNMANTALSLRKHTGVRTQAAVDAVVMLLPKEGFPMFVLFKHLF
jgi:hypothetical protein